MDDQPLSDRVFHHFLALLRFTRQHARQLSDERGIKPREHSVLRFLLEAGPVTVGQVQAYFHKSPSTTSTLLAQLELKGWLTRTRSQEDNRVVIVELTPAGRDIAQNTPLGGLPLLRRRLATLPEERLGQIDEVLAEIKRLMEVTSAE
jgi:DNA-binding MarR family transcriptional regulator